MAQVSLHHRRRRSHYPQILDDGCRKLRHLKARCTKAKNRVISRWEHEHVLEAAQKRLDQNPQAMRARRETVEHPFGTLKMRMGATHFLMKRLPKVATEMALHVLAYNLTRVMNIMGVKPLIAAMSIVKSRKKQLASQPRLVPDLCGKAF